MTNEGLVLAGTVTGRAKRLVGADRTELVTYKILAGGKEFLVKDWNPDGVYFGVGDIVESPVTVKVYQKNGFASLDYAVLRKNAALGVEF